MGFESQKIPDRMTGRVVVARVEPSGRKILHQKYFEYLRRDAALAS
jgi:hypothetical protein